MSTDVNRLILAASAKTDEVIQITYIWDLATLNRN